MRRAAFALMNLSWERMNLAQFLEPRSRAKCGLLQAATYTTVSIRSDENETFLPHNRQLPSLKLSILFIGICLKNTSFYKQLSHFLAN